MTTVAMPTTTVRARRTWTVIGSVFAVAAIAFGTFQVVDVFSFARLHFERTLRGPVEHVEVRNGAGYVHVVAGADNVARIAGKGGRGLSKPTHDERLVDGRLVVSARCPNPLGSYCDMGLTITVPPSAQLTLHSGEGSVLVDGGRDGWAGAIDASSSGGRVVVTNAHGALRLHSSASRVVGEDLSSADVNATSSGGRVELTFSEPPRTVVASSSASRVIVKLPRTTDTYAVDAHSSASSERVSVLTSSTSSRSIDARSSGGRVEVRYRD